MQKLQNRMKTDLKEAMKQRQKETVTALRTVLAAIANAEAVAVDTSFVPMVGKTNDVPRKALTVDDVQQILKAKISERSIAVAEYEGLGQNDAAAELRAEVKVLEKYVN